MQGRSINDLLQIVRNGGSLTMCAAGRSTEDLIQIVRNANVNSHITFRGLSGRSIGDLVQIARNKVGMVTLSD